MDVVMTESTGAIWPEYGTRPIRRLAAALLLAPLALSALMTLIVFLTHLGSGDFAEALASGIAAAMVFTGTMAVMTVTFGLAGVTALWMLDQRGLVAWLSTGLFCGCLFGMAHGIVTAGLISDFNLVFAGAVGTALFGLIRKIAGIHD